MPEVPDNRMGNPGQRFPKQWKAVKCLAVRVGWRDLRNIMISRAMLYWHVSALNEKTGTKSRIGLIQFYYNWEEDKK